MLDSGRGQQQERRTPQQIVHFCQETSQNIQTERNKAWRRVQETGNPISLDQFDNVLENSNDKLFKHIITQGFDEVVPAIVDIFKDIMDPETKRFLITAETVRAFADKYRPPNFDYSAPGCGLWKAVERELNLSLVLHLRRAAGIVKNVYYPWKKSESGTFPILTGANRSVDLNQSKGIMLGPMQDMLKWGHCNTVREKLGNLFSNAFDIDSLLGQHASKEDTLPQFLDKIRTLRNGHAHISAMSRQEFGELRNLVLSSKSKLTGQCLLIILALKVAVFHYWGKDDVLTDLTTESGKTVAFWNYNKMIIRRDGSNWDAIHGNLSELCIATFGTKDDAENARTALDKAAGTDKTWDVREFI